LILDACLRKWVNNELFSSCHIPTVTRNGILIWKRNRIWTRLEEQFIGQVIYTTTLWQTGPCCSLFNILPKAQKWLKTKWPTGCILRAAQTSLHCKHEILDLNKFRNHTFVIVKLRAMLFICFTIKCLHRY